MQGVVKYIKYVDILLMLAT